MNKDVVGMKIVLILIVQHGTHLILVGRLLVTLTLINVDVDHVRLTTIVKRDIAVIKNFQAGAVSVGKRVMSLTINTYVTRLTEGSYR